jgi:hypothetical protein
VLLLLSSNYKTGNPGELDIRVSETVYRVTVEPLCLGLRGRYTLHFSFANAR